MSRGFLAGAGWGTVVAGLGLVVASLVVELESGAENRVAGDGAVAELAPKATAVEPSVAPSDMGSVATVVPDAPQDSAPAMNAPIYEVDGKPDVPRDNTGPTMVSAPESVAPENMGVDALANVAVNAPETPEAIPEAKAELGMSALTELGPAPDMPIATDPAPNEASMAIGGAPQPAPADAAPESVLSPVEPAPEAAPTPDMVVANDEAVLDAPEGVAQESMQPDAASSEGLLPESVSPGIVPEENVTAEASAPEVVEPEVEIVVIDPPASRPAPGFVGVDGVKTGRLPSIGVPSAANPEAAVTTAEASATSDANLPPIERYARKFENTEQKPLFAILLRDTGGPDVDREALAAIPFPVSFVIDPTQPDAAVAAKIYRTAGQEVLMLGSGIPAGANASDLAVSFEAMDGILPEAVGVVDQETDGFQGNRILATQVLALVADQGRGVISWDKGLNAASQVARREGVRNAVIFRSMDGADEKSAVILRYLDRAAFKAAQDGRVVVQGQTRPETVQALLEWAVEGRAATVAIAPATAVMTAQK